MVITQTILHNIFDRKRQISDIILNILVIILIDLTLHPFELIIGPAVIINPSPLIDTQENHAQGIEIDFDIISLVI